MDEPKIWVRDLPKILRKVYKEIGVPFPNKPDQALIDLAEWFMRVPTESPKIVHKSQELQRKVLTPFELKNLSEIERVVAIGGDLKPYLGDISRSVRNRQSKKNDFFSSDWGLLHFHLGADFENKKTRVSRSKRVLLARFEKDNAYFIDIVNHGRGYPEVWGDTVHLEILYKNWPHVLAGGMMRDVILDKEGKKISAMDYIKLRNAGINVPIVINGKSFIPPGFGIATDGSQTQAVTVALQINRELNEAETEFRKEELDEKVFLVVKNKYSVGFLVPKRNTYFCMYKYSEESQVAKFFIRLLSEVSLVADKKYNEFITPKRIKI